MSIITDLLTELHQLEGVTVASETINPGATDEQIGQLTAAFPGDEELVAFYREHNGCRIHWQGSLSASQWGCIQFRSIENLVAENGLLVSDERNPESDIRLIKHDDGSLWLVLRDYDGHQIGPEITFSQLLILLKLTRGYFNWAYYFNVQITQRDIEMIKIIEDDLKPLFPDFDPMLFLRAIG